MPWVCTVVVVREPETSGCVNDADFESSKVNSHGAFSVLASNTMTPGHRIDLNAARVFSLFHLCIPACTSQGDI